MVVLDQFPIGSYNLGGLSFCENMNEGSLAVKALVKGAVGYIIFKSS